MQENQETWVWSLGREDPLEKEMATHSSILAWEIPWTEEPWQATIHGVAKTQTWLSDWAHRHRNFPSRTCTLVTVTCDNRVQHAIMWGGYILFSFQEIPISSLSCSAWFAFLVYCQHWLLFPGEFRRREETIWPINLPKSLLLKFISSERHLCHQGGPWVRMIGQRQTGNQLLYHKTWDC